MDCPEVVVIEVTGDLWDYPADIRCITTNGFVKKNGECVMGRGCAFEAKTRWPELPRQLGNILKINGNVVSFLRDFPDNPLLSFPVKHNWWERADIALIEKSARDLRTLIDGLGANVVVLPRPGCGNGQLNWDDVRPILAPILDDRFHVITF